MTDRPRDLQHSLTPFSGRVAAEPNRASEPLPADDGIAPLEVLRAIRRNLPLFTISAGLTLALGALALLSSPSDYSARAVIRMAGERRTLTTGVEDAPQAVDRPVD